MKHTKEPWGVGDKGKTVLKTYSPTKAKILVEGVNFFNEDLNKANIERIVACVNACAGITNEALEADVVSRCINEVGEEHSYSDGSDINDYLGVKVWEEEDGK